jgi:hypothetical protein
MQKPRMSAMVKGTPRPPTARGGYAFPTFTQTQKDGYVKKAKQFRISQNDRLNGTSGNA